MKQKSKRSVVLSFMFIVAIIAVLFAACEKPADAGEISKYDSESHIAVSGNESGTSSGGDAGFIVRDRKYDYEGNNLVVLNVENQTNKNYSITINGQYLDGNGNILKEESKTFEGVAAGWKNNFFFVPEIPFERFTYSLDAEEYTGECFARSFRYTWELVEIANAVPWDAWSQDDASYAAALSRGESDAPVPQTYFVPAISFEIYREYEITEPVHVYEDVIILNSQGEIIDVKPQWFNAKCTPGDKSNNGHVYYFFPDPNDREWPEKLKDDLTVLFGIVSAKKSD